MRISVSTLLTHSEQKSRRAISLAIKHFFVVFICVQWDGLVSPIDGCWSLYFITTPISVLSIKIESYPYEYHDTLVSKVEHGRMIRTRSAAERYEINKGRLNSERSSSLYGK